MKKLSSLTIFFPFYNDEGTVIPLIDSAYTIGKKVAKKLEIIAIHGGKSRDQTFQSILKAKKNHDDLIIIDQSNNTEGYAVIKYGFAKATKEWIFYTDGDLQYHLEEDLIKLVEAQFRTNADVINGYKKRRNDSSLRIVCGKIYAHLSRIIFKLPISDIDCDFRLIRKKYIDQIVLKSSDSSILPELIKRLHIVGARFAEIPVAHYPRTYGRSNYTIVGLIREKIAGDLKLYMMLYITN